MKYPLEDRRAIFLIGTPIVSDGERESLNGLDVILYTRKEASQFIFSTFTSIPLYEFLI